MTTNATIRPHALAAGGLLLIALVLGFPATGWSQEGATPALITLSADSVSVNELLQLLAQRSHLNIVTGPEVQGRRISIRLENTPFDEALNLVVRAAGLGYERVGSSILVADVQRLSTPTGLVTRVFDLQNGRAGEIGEMLSVISPNVTANASGNRLVIRATQSAVEEAAQVVSHLDRKPRQVLLESRLIEVNRSALTEVGIDWERITKLTSVVVEGAAEPSPPDHLPAEMGYLRLDDSADFYRQQKAFEIALDALITDGSARLLSNAKVLTVDGERAEIFAGETVPVVITSLQSPGVGGGVLQTVQLEKIDVGVKLSITPRIGADGYITTLVEPEVSRIVAFVGPDDDLPQTSTRRARTLVRVQEGRKIYLGGLISEEERSTVKKVPLLGHIPLLGYLFQHHRTERIQLDLVIEITPHIVGDEGADSSTPTAFPERG